MKRTIALLPLVVIGVATAGQPLHQVLKLRTIEVLHCAAVTADSVGGVSSYVRAKSDSHVDRKIADSVADEVAGSVPGLLVEAIVRRQRDVTFPIFGNRKPINKSTWIVSDNSDPLKFFVPTNQPDACDIFVSATRVNVVLSQKAECDTFPPAGLCAFDLPIRVVDSETWVKYGE